MIRNRKRQRERKKEQKGEARLEIRTLTHRDLTPFNAVNRIRGNKEIAL